MLNKRYNSLNDWLVARFGERLFKVSLESGLSCPNKDGTLDNRGCVFCNLASHRPASNPEKDAKGLSIFGQLKNGIEYVRRRHHVSRVISYFQSGSNTHAPAEKLEPIFNEAIAHPKVSGLAISTRPDCLNAAHYEMFERLSAKTFLWVELGLQSSHNETLKKINRGHNAEQFAAACAELNKRSVPVCAHVILGLPDETPKMMLETAQFLNDLNVWGVKIHNLHVLKQTKLAEEYLVGKIKIPTLEIYANWVVDFLEALSPQTVIHRVNSHSPRSLTVAPEWSVNKLAIFNAVEKEMERRDTQQGKNCR